MQRHLTILTAGSVFAADNGRCNRPLNTKQHKVTKQKTLSYASEDASLFYT